MDLSIARFAAVSSVMSTPATGSAPAARRGFDAVLAQSGAKPRSSEVASRAASMVGTTITPQRGACACAAMVDAAASNGAEPLPTGERAGPASVPQPSAGASWARPTSPPTPSTTATAPALWAELSRVGRSVSVDPQAAQPGDLLRLIGADGAGEHLAIVSSLQTMVAPDARGVVLTQPIPWDRVRGARRLT